MRQQRLIAIACLGALFVCSAAWGAPQDSQQNASDTSTEESAYQAARNEKDPQAKLILLDDFAAKYPSSALMPEAYRDYYEAYFSVENYAEAIGYADKLVALGDKIDVDSRLLALITREVAFSLGCSRPDLQTRQAFTKARDAGQQALELIGQWQKAANVTDEQFDAAKKSFSIIASQIMETGEAGLAGKPISCYPHPLGEDQERFNRMIQDLQEQERESPNVR